MKMKDITGQRFGKLTAIKPTDERCNGSVIWECKCDCGNTTYVRAAALRFNRNQSCGCVSGNKATDLTGQRFGKLVAIRETDERRNRSIMWECKCDCGNTTYVRAIALRSNGTQSCGCVSADRAVDLTGQRFGKLTAIKPTDERRNRSVMWECKCDCGNTTYVRVGNLRPGGTTSCGCERGGMGADLTGQRFGKLVAIRETDERRNGNVMWECKCDCGNTTYVRVAALRSGNSTSCGCKRARKRV